MVDETGKEREKKVLAELAFESFHRYIQREGNISFMTLYKSWKLLATEFQNLQYTVYMISGKTVEEKR